MPDLTPIASHLVRRLRSTQWPKGSDRADLTSHGLDPRTVQAHAEAWSSWLQQEDGEPSRRHEPVAVPGGEVGVMRFPGSGRVPLLLLHGWPTSFLAFHRVVEPLCERASEVLLGTLPGFGSIPTPDCGLGVEAMAGLFLDAMSHLGHEKFVVHGQDWGSAVAREIGLRAPGRVIGVHVSAGLRGFMAEGPGADDTWPQLTEFALEGAGYLQLQSRRPDSLAIALTDSPAGLLAWHLDKYQLWQAQLGPDFGLGEDFIYANATLYWATHSIASSMRIYTANRDPAPGPRSPVPTAVSVFGTGDFAARSVAERENHLVAWYQHRSGGHVAALDAPDEFVADLTDFLERVGARP